MLQNFNKLITVLQYQRWVMANADTFLLGYFKITFWGGSNVITLRLVHYLQPYRTYLLLPVGVEKKGWAARAAGRVG